MTCPSDEELMTRFSRALDEDALAELVSRYLPRAVRYAFFLMQNHADAEDAVQEAFLRLLRAHRTYDPSHAFAPWFFTVLRNTCRDMHRSRKRTSSLHASVEEKSRVPDEQPGGLAADILGGVPEPERHLLVMRYLHGLSVEEIARVLDCSYEAAKKRCQRALLKAREFLASMGFF